MADGRKLALAVIGGGQAAAKAIGSFDTSTRDDLACVLCRADELATIDRSVIRAASFENILADCEINTVYIATPVNTHVALAKMALERGKNVLIEKPLGLSVRDGSDLRQYARRLVIGVAFKKRFAGAYTHLQRLLPGLKNPSATFEWSIPMPASKWRYSRAEAGGGVVMDLGSHVLDLYEFLFGPIVAVEATTCPCEQSLEVECHARLIVQFASGAASNIDLTWGSTFRQRCDVTDGHRRVRVERLLSGDDVVEDGDERRTFAQQTEYTGLIANLRMEVVSGRSDLPGLAAGLRNLQLIEAAYESARTRKPIAVPSRNP